MFTRVDKAVRTILTKIRIEGMWEGMNDPDMQKWADEIWQEFVRTGWLERLATKYGVPADEAMERIEAVRIEYTDVEGTEDIEEMTEAEIKQKIREYSTGLYVPTPDGKSAYISVEVTPPVYINDKKEMVFDTLLHELDHHFYGQASGIQTMGMLPGIGYFELPHEREARKSEVENMLEDGHSKDEILAIWVEVNDAENKPEIIAFLRNLIEEVAQETGYAGGVY